MAEAYRDAYMDHDVHAGGSYAEWEYADDAVYSSPYFTGDTVLPLDENLAVGAAAKCWPSPGVRPHSPVFDASPSSMGGQTFGARRALQTGRARQQRRWRSIFESAAQHSPDA